MKKILLLIAVICFLSISMLNAQFNKGRILLGISTSSNNLYNMYSGGSSNFFHLGFTTYKTKSDNGNGDSEKIRTFNLSPRFGCFIAKNLSVGIDINISLMSMGTGNNNETTTLSGIGPFLRYYLPLKKVAPFAEIEGSFGSVRNKYTDYLGAKVVDKTAITSFLGAIGLAVPVGDKFAFDMMLGYVSTTLKARQNNTNNEREILGTFAIKVGFNLYLGAN